MGWGNITTRSDQTLVSAVVPESIICFGPQGALDYKAQYQN